MEIINAKIKIINNKHRTTHVVYIAGDSIVDILNHLEWEHFIVRNNEEQRYDISADIQYIHNAAKIVIEYHFEDGKTTTETITTLEK